MSEACPKRLPMSRFRPSKCAVPSLGDEWRCSASRTAGKQLGPLPAFLLPLRANNGPLVRHRLRRIRHGPDQCGPSGTPIGWHRDALQYDIVAGLSLLSACRMKFRPYRSPSALTVASSVGNTKSG